MDSEQQRRIWLILLLICVILMCIPLQIVLWPYYSPNKTVLWSVNIFSVVIVTLIIIKMIMDGWRLLKTTGSKQLKREFIGISFMSLFFIAWTLFVDIGLFITAHGSSSDSNESILPILLYEFQNGSFDEIISAGNPRYKLINNNNNNGLNIINNTLLCDGYHNHYLYTQNNINFNLTSHSLVIEVKISNNITNTNNGGDMISINKYYDKCDDNDYYVYNSMAYYENKWYSDYDDTNWIHFVITYDANNKTMTMYRNGIKYNQSYDSHIGDDDNVESKGWKLMVCPTDYNSSFNFQGEINYIAIHDIALNVDEIKRIYKYGPNKPEKTENDELLYEDINLSTPRLLYSFINNSFDETMSGKNIKYQLTQGIESNITFNNNSLICDSDSDYLYTPNNLDFILKSHSLEFYINGRGISAMSINIFDENVACIADNRSSSLSQTAANNEISDNITSIKDWIHIVTTYDYDCNTIDFYKNGIKYGDSKQLQSDSFPNLNKGRKLMFCQQFDGAVKYGALYDYKLSVQQINKLYMDGPYISRQCNKLQNSSNYNRRETNDDEVILYESLRSLNAMDNVGCLTGIHIENEMIFEIDFVIQEFCESELCLFFHIGYQTNYESQINNQYPAIWLTKYGLAVSFTNNNYKQPIEIEIASLSLNKLYSLQIRLNEKSYSIIVNQIEHKSVYDPNHESINEELPIYINSLWYQAANIEINKIKIYYIRLDVARILIFSFFGLIVLFFLFFVMCLSMKYYQNKKAVKSRINSLNWKKLESEITEQIQYISNPLILFYGIEDYYDKVLNPGFNGYCRNLDGMERDFERIRDWAKENNYKMYPTQFIPTWSKQELLESLKKCAKHAAMMDEDENGRSYDCIIVIISGHGIDGSIITSDYQLFHKVAIHGLFSVNYPKSLRNKPRIFMFDYIDNNDKGKNINDGDIKFNAATNKYKIWKRDENNPDFKLIRIDAKIDSVDGSYLIRTFIECITMESEKERFFGDIIDNVQHKLHEMGKQQITALFNNGTCWLVFEKKCAFQCNDGHSLHYKSVGYNWCCDRCGKEHKDRRDVLHDLCDCIFCYCDLCEINKKQSSSKKKVFHCGECRWSYDVCKECNHSAFDNQDDDDDVILDDDEKYNKSDIDEKYDGNAIKKRKRNGNNNNNNNNLLNNNPFYIEMQQFIE